MSNPRILTLDIETAPATAFIWKTYKENISPDQVITPTRTLCFAAKWLHDSDVIYDGENTNSHEGMIQTAWDLLDEADMVIHYNGESFDIPHLRREFKQAGLGPPSPFKQIDLLKTARREFRFLSNRLQQVSVELGLEGKIHTDFTLWRRIVLDNEEAAWDEMQRYVCQDVRDEEQVYLELLPWIQGHPNLNLYLPVDAAHPRCPNCGSDRMQRRGVQKTQVSVYPRYQCQSCGHWSRGGRRNEHVDVRSFTA